MESSRRRWLDVVGEICILPGEVETVPRKNKVASGSGHSLALHASPKTSTNLQTDRRRRPHLCSIRQEPRPRIISQAGRTRGTLFPFFHIPKSIPYALAPSDTRIQKGGRADKADRQRLYQALSRQPRQLGAPRRAGRRGFNEPLADFSQ